MSLSKLKKTVNLAKSLPKKIKKYVKTPKKKYEFVQLGGGLPKLRRRKAK